jgi:hypothetical protein
MEPSNHPLEPRYDPRPASRFHAIKPRQVKIVTNAHKRVTGVTWDLLDTLRYIAHHENRLGLWGTADAASLVAPVLVSAEEAGRISLEPRQVLRLNVLQ